MASKYTTLYKRVKDPTTITLAILAGAPLWTSDVHWQLFEGDIAYIVNLRGKREYYERTGVKWGP